MNISKDDPRLTAFALGEIEDKDENAAIEAAVNNDPELQKAVASIRGMAEMLGESLKSENSPELSEFEKARMGQNTSERKRATAVAPGLGRLVSLPFLSAGVAAVAVVALLFVIPVGTMFQSPGDFNEAADVAVVQGKVPEIPPPAVVEDKDAPTLSMELLRDSGPPAENKEEVFELSPFEVTTESDSGYASREPVAQPAAKLNTLTATRQMSDQTFSIAAMPGPVDRDEGWNTEQYDMIEETGFRSPLVAPLSTFSIDVDTASYANVRRFLKQGQLPPKDAVRIEELINYFPYSDAPPTVSLEDGGDPFAVHMEQAVAPWNKKHQLLRIGLKGYIMPWDERPASNLVFLLDVSGSMNQPNKLPLLKTAMELLVRRLDSRDRVAIVVYAGASGLVLPSTSANNHATIEHALKQLSAGGSTNAGAGIQLAYKVATENLIPDGNNRVILCTDGDFNVGQTNRGSLAEVAEEQAEKGISLTVLGFGMGNFKDGMLETLSNKGKGSYAYVDSESEARKVFLEDLTSNLFKIAKDVKIQVEFNPGQVSAYRLIGYENRRLKAEDFNNDQKKAGDIGPGHSIVALYELIPSGTNTELPVVDPLKYQESDVAGNSSNEVATVKLRYKMPEADTSKLITHSVQVSDSKGFAEATDDFRFAASVAAFGMRLRESEFVKEFPYREIEMIAAGSIGNDPGGHRSGFTGLVRKAEAIENSDEPEMEPNHTVND